MTTIQQAMHATDAAAQLRADFFAEFLARGWRHLVRALTPTGRDGLTPQRVSA